MYSSRQTPTQTSEFCLARLLCVLGLVLVTFLGISELGTQATERRRLWSKHYVRKEWNEAEKDPQNIIGRKEGYQFFSTKDKNNFFGACCVPFGYVGAFAWLVKQFRPQYWGSNAPTYEFKVGKLMDKKETQVILVRLTKTNSKKSEFAYLKRVEIEAIPATFISKENEHLKYSVRFVLNSLKSGWNKRMCDRHVFYLTKEELEQLQNIETGILEAHGLAELLRNMIRHPKIKLTLSESGNILSNEEEAKEKKNDKFVQIQFKARNEKTNARLKKFVLCTDVKSSEVNFYSKGKLIKQSKKRRNKKSVKKNVCAFMEPTFNKLRRDVQAFYGEESVDTVEQLFKEKLEAARKRSKARAAAKKKAAEEIVRLQRGKIVRGAKIVTLAD